MKKGKFVWSVFGILTGICSIIASIVVWLQNCGDYEWNEAYGGDAYTGIQNASAQSANNVLSLTELVKMALGFGLLILGIAMICYFAIKICEACGEGAKKDIKSEEIATEALAEEINETEPEALCEAETEEAAETE